MALSDPLKWLHVSSLWVYRALTWVVLGAGFVCAVAVLSLRYWLLPNIEQYRDDIARAVSRAANQRITIDKISASWKGLRPELILENVVVFDGAGKPALELSRIDSTLSWLSLTALEPRFRSLSFDQPVVNIRRDARGKIWVGGIELPREPEEGGGVADWLLRQRDIRVREATISWLDEMRGAPPLDLKHVQLRIENRGKRHRFGFHALAPEHLAGPLDVRGDLRGGTVAALSEWNGKLFLEVDYADIAAWRSWVLFPIEFPRGAGALRAWLGFSQRQLTELTADVQLAGVRTRLAKDLPELDLTALSGRIAWKAVADGFEFSTTRLGLTTEGGLSLRPTDFLLRVGEGKGNKPGRSELQANELDLQPLVMLADRLPLDAELRKQLVNLSPKGSLYDVAVHWSGDWRNPVQYGARGRFYDLTLNPSGKVPGFSGVTGTIEGNEKTGSLQLSTRNTTVDMPLVFRDPLGFDDLTAHVNWLRSGSEIELKLNNVSFSNQHLAGTLSGSYRSVPESRGVIDLTGALTRADARYASRYIPLVIGKRARDWLDTAFIAGQSRDVSLRVKGNLDDFPFPDNKGGVFQVLAKITDGVLNYAEGWPKVENIAGEVNFRGKRMDVLARQGTILGTKLAKVRAEIPDLKDGDQILHLTGEAEGATGDFLAFIEKSPVSEMIDGFTEGMSAQGNGRLMLTLELPLGVSNAKSKVAGAYQFSNNQIVGNVDLPPVEQASGRLEFTESTVRVTNAAGVFLGGPITVSAATQPDSSVRINLQGRANVDNLRRSAGSPSWAQNVRGSTDWRGTYVLRKKFVDLLIESNLQGISFDLPPPLVKSAGESVPLRYERRYAGSQQDQIIVSYGAIVSANLQRRIEDGRSVIRRGTIRFGEAAPEPDRDGVVMGGKVKSLDLGRWMEFADQNAGGPKFELSAIDLSIEALDAFHRRFNDVSINGARQGGVWQTNVTGRELEGAVTWQPQGRGKLTARMKRLSIPGDTAPGAARPASEKSAEYPALDLIAEQFQLKNKQLGRLELNAVPENRDWRIEKLRINNPEGALLVDGVWQQGASPPRTQVNLHLETSDIGNLLGRLGYPESVRRGTAKLSGALSWAGGPLDFDYPTLSGNLTVEAVKGQFLKLEPGIGKLLGILSLQALPRRITLDFRDIFSEGFAFDEIAGACTINRGVATTSNFRLQGPSARVLMSGEVNLAQETQKLRVRVSPSISDAASIAGALLGGPVAGVATFLAQKVLKDPLDQMVAYEYNVTGTWVDPQVSKIAQRGGQEPGRAQ